MDLYSEANVFAALRLLSQSAITRISSVFLVTELLVLWYPAVLRSASMAAQTVFRGVYSACMFFRPCVRGGRQRVGDAAVPQG